MGSSGLTGVPPSAGVTVTSASLVGVVVTALPEEPGLSPVETVHPATSIIAAAAHTAPAIRICARDNIWPPEIPEPTHAEGDPRRPYDSAQI
jgi:hypothetical protein